MKPTSLKVIFKYFLFLFWCCGCKDIQQTQKDISGKKFLETLRKTLSFRKKILIGGKENKKLDSVSLSATAVKRKILDLSLDVLEQNVSQMNAFPFSAIQLDESTDIAGLPQLSVFIRPISYGEILRWIYSASVFRPFLSVFLCFCFSVKK